MSKLPRSLLVHGFAVPSQGFDDLKGLDLRGKIAVIYGGSPSSVHGPSEGVLPHSWAKMEGTQGGGGYWHHHHS